MMMKTLFLWELMGNHSSSALNISAFVIEWTIGRFKFSDIENATLLEEIKAVNRTVLSPRENTPS